MTRRRAMLALLLVARLVWRAASALRERAARVSAENEEHTQQQREQQQQQQQVPQAQDEPPPEEGLQIGSGAGRDSRPGRLTIWAFL